jgi:omega-hydroxy-beta-dihydromenaquinone-9 sulfotransferase
VSRRAPAFIPAGRALVSWLARDPELARTWRARLWAYRWKAYWFDTNWRRQEALYPGAAFHGDGRNLVFVMGFWRSGTTLLHALLAAGPGMAAPQTWQCMNPSGFRIAGAPAAASAVSRPMDAVLVSALSPQEDEFALLARGAPSVYRAWLDPRRWEQTLPALEQDTWLAADDSRWLADWRTFLGWCLPGGASVLVVKSPNHVFRLKALRRAWPRARMVWTLRDPVDTWFSNRKMWRAMNALYGLRQWRAEDLDRLLFHALGEYAAALRWALDARDAHVMLAYEQLTAATGEALEDLTARLHLGTWESWRPLLDQRLRESAGYRRETYEVGQPLPPYANRLVEEIRELHRTLARPAGVAA